MDQVPPQLRVWQLALGFANTEVLYAIVRAGVVEQLRDQPKSVPELAQACKLNADVLYRTLRFAGAIGVVTQEGEEYSLTDVGRLLLKDVPGSLYMGLLLAGSEPWQRAWHNFAHALATGEDAFRPVMGTSFFEYLNQHPESGTPFNQWMTIVTTLEAGAIAEAYDFRPFGTVCDIGGGHGILLKTILETNPRLRGVLYDQESVVKDHVLTDLPRAQIQTGSFFERVPAADVLLLKNVLHDWSDEKCQVLLSRCRQAMQPSSRLLIIDRVIGSPADLIGSFYDLHMQLIQGGRERTEKEFSSLLQKAGMKLNRIIPTQSPMKIIEASV
jgi:O-methyltransferase domain